MRVILAATEMAPLLKLGGLGDVIGSLPKELKKLGVDVSVIIPFYHEVEVSKSQKPLCSYSIAFAGQDESVSIYKTSVDDVPVYLVDNQKYIDLYEKVAIAFDQREVDHYAFFSKSVVEFLGREYDGIFDIVHLHDWHVGLVPHLFRVLFPNRIKPSFLFTIHNLGYHGYSETELIKRLAIKNITEISDDPFFDFDARQDDQLDLLLQGLIGSDYISTVSPTYAKEIQTKEYCDGLCDILQIRSNKLYGIINGLDTELWNPKSDRDIYATYALEPISEKDTPSLISKRIMDAKDLNKASLQHDLHLTVDKRVPLLGFVGRLEPGQKGLDLLYDAITSLLSDASFRFQFALIGVGLPEWEERFRALAESNPKRVSASIVFDEQIARRIYAASDLMLIPSRYEPCGLVQLIAMRYGAVPIVRATGGLKDTVEDGVDGLVFENYDSYEFVNKIKSGLNSYNYDDQHFKEMIIRGMSKDFSWNQPAKEYMNLYQKIFTNR
ncbi:glycogen synthase [candidate division WWE3 bacterium]|nr:glycogen synthase [candidate division WWE3 bacterium]